jgi:hypothetical protein
MTNANPERPESYISYRVMGFVLMVVVYMAVLVGRAGAQWVGDEVTCNAAVFYDTAVNGTTTLVTANPTGGIYVCGFDISAAAATATVKVQFSYATATAGALQTPITPNFTFTSVTTALVDSASPWRGLYVPAGENPEITTNATQSIQGVLFYYQQSTK